MKKNKTIKIIFLSIILIILLIGCFYIVKSNQKTNFNKEYTLVSKDNVFEEKSSEEIIKILKNGTGIVFLGFPECPWCQHYAKILDDLSHEEGIKVIYYYNIKKDREKNNETYKEIVSLLNDNLDYDKEGNKRIYVPDVSFVYNGDIIYHTNETSMITEDITPEQYWTKDKEETTKKELSKYINKINDSMCTSCNE